MGNKHTTMRLAVGGVAVAATLGLAGSASATTNAQTRYVQTADGRYVAVGVGAGGASGPTNAQTHYVRVDGRWVPVGTGGSVAPAANSATPAKSGGVPAEKGARCVPCPHEHGVPARPMPAKPLPGPAVVKPTHKYVAPAAITAKPDVKSVEAWHIFRVTGSTSGIAPGSMITLQQHEQHGRFVSLPASMHTNRHGGYQLRVELGIKGVNDLRIISGHVISPVFKVTVR